jgi:hypothetical protein
MPGLALVLLGLALLVASFIALVTYRGRPQTPAASSTQTSPPVCDAAVETPEVGEAFPPTSPASGTSFDEHADQAMDVANAGQMPPPIVAWCAPCGAVQHFHTLAQVMAHIRTHTDPALADWDQWEREVSQS